MKRYTGVVQNIWVDEDGYEHVDDIKAEVNRLVSSLEQAEREAQAAKQELVDFRNKRSWTEVELVRDERSGLAAVIRTDYRLRAEHIRLDYDPRMGGFPGATTLEEGLQ